MIYVSPISLRVEGANVIFMLGSELCQLKIYFFEMYLLVSLSELILTIDLEFWMMAGEFIVVSGAKLDLVFSWMLIGLNEFTESIAVPFKVVYLFMFRVNRS